MRKSQRVFSVDVLRTLAILFMVQGHFMYYWTPWDKLWQAGEIAHHGLLRWWIDFDNFSAPIFAFLAGFSVWFWIAKNQQLMPTKVYSTQLLKRGFLIFLCGFAISYLVREDLMLSNILNLIGGGIMLVALLHRAPVWVFAALIMGILVMSPIGQAWSEYAVLSFNQIDWPTKRLTFSGWEMWKEMGVNYLVRSYQPFLPWIIFPLFGFVCARCWFSVPVKKYYRYLLGLGGVLLVGSVILQTGWLTANPYLTAFNYYPMTSPMALASLAVTILSLLVLYFCFDYKQVPLGKILTIFFKIYSRFSLTVYVFHNLVLISVVRWGSWYFTGMEWSYYARLMTVPQGLLSAWVFILLFYVLIYYWYQLNGGKYSLEWWLRYLSTVGTK